MSVVAVLAYLFLAIWLPLGVNHKGIRSRLAFMGRYALILIIAAEAVIVPTVNNIIERALTPIAADGFSPADVKLSDSGLQTELALTFLVDGLNPYGERYEETPLRFYQWQDVDDPNWQDPAFEYFVYLPANLYVSWPVYQGMAQVGLPYDQRVVFLLFYIAILLVLPQLVREPVLKLALVAGVGLNPLFTKTVVLGMNDTAVFFFLLLMFLMLTRRKFLAAAIFMGIACAFKQYAWFMGPFYLLALWQEAPPDRRWWQVIVSLGIIGGIVLLSVLPFVLWNFDALYTDTLAFPAGRAAYLYPIRGFTVGRLLMGTGVIHSFVEPFPFQLLQAILGLPLLFFLLRYQRGRSLGSMVLAASCFIVGIGFLSRFFHENYVGVVIALATIGILLDLSAVPDKGFTDVV